MKALSVCPEELLLSVRKLEAGLQEREALLVQLAQKTETAANRLQGGAYADFAGRLEHCLRQQEQLADQAEALCRAVSAFGQAAEECGEELRAGLPELDGAEAVCGGTGSLVFDYDAVRRFSSCLPEENGELARRLEEISERLSLEEDLFLQTLTNID